MELPISWNDTSLLDHEPLLSYCYLYSLSSRGGSKAIINNFVNEMQGNSRALAAAQAWLRLAFPPRNDETETLGLSANDPKMLAIFFEFYRLLQAKNHPAEYLLQKKRELLSSPATQGTQSGRGGHSAKARGREVNGSRSRGSGSGSGSGQGQGHGRGRGRRRSGQECSSPTPLAITEAPQEHSRTSEAPESNDAPDGKCMRDSSGGISSIDLPISPQSPSQEYYSDDVPSLPVCQLSGSIHPGLASSSLSGVDSTTHAGQDTQVLANSNLSQNHGQDSRLQLDDSDHFIARSSELMVARALPPSTRSLRPLPRKVATKYIPPRHGQQITYVQPSRQTLDQEGIDRLLTDIGRNASLMHSQTISVHMEDWAHDDDQDDVEDVDDIANEFDAPSTNDALPPSSSCKEVTDVSAPTIEEQKPPLLAMPPIWAESRQEVCESFDYFRSYQGGVYSSKDIVKGYLLGGSPASRDIFHCGGKVIISHGGGKSESILDYRVGPARFQQAQDQEATDKSVRALLRSYTDKRPLVLLADEKYALFPFDLGASGCTYVVLGSYWISHAWAEYQPASNGCGRVVRWKFAFRWCEGQGNPWWISSKSNDVDMLSDPTRDCQSAPRQDPSPPNAVASVACSKCSQKSPVVYSQGWMCLNPSCTSFWSLGGRELEQLDYDTAFLRPIAMLFTSLPELRPAKLIETMDSITTSYAFSKGWHCEKCGRLSSRFKWEHWECSNCHSIHKVPGRLRIAKEFWHQRPPAEFLHSRVGKQSGIIARRPEPFELGDGGGFTNYLTFILPHERGRIHLILGTPLANKRADEVFRQYQEQADEGELLLRRYPLRLKKLRGTFLTNYFSQNSGEPYQYVGGTGNTVPFDKAPSSVCGALALIKERSRLALQKDIPFNEILSAAYMEKQKMSFHSDSEHGLGPVVASLSLGSAAFMHFRARATSKEAKHASSNALTLILRHGDVLIMEGDGIQQHYEHTVIPMNFRIAATARCIGIA
ncbi:hypothetical protein EV702DRAFT_1104717 [Suillus placidus]|uniref:Alpha-ketoglutarate-dependent dioxygenase AlkB-like domain-containing protein n=1 Tax=Suillus placidus TaxID=48579 RepID=A0A9P7D3D5_9AGAM|nr:hypothetical protein EV702DRAFT_1104717 [Suillus placidus]